VVGIAVQIEKQVAGGGPELIEQRPVAPFAQVRYALETAPFGGPAIS
jgi:hypothetical protein